MSFQTLLPLVFGAIGFYYYISKKRGGGPLPPGPKGLPIIGNVADVPTEQEWKTYAEWGRKWGGIIHLSLMGQSLVIVNSADIMDEFDKQGANYSDRPVLQMAGELVGFNNGMGLLRYGPRLRAYRKHFSRFVGPNKPIQSHQPLIEEETRKFLRRTVENSGDLSHNLRKLAGSIILNLTYGYKAEDGQDKFVDLVEHHNKVFSLAAKPGVFLVDVLPWLKYLPEWLPGTGFLKLAREWRKTAEETANTPYAYTESQMAAGTALTSLVSTGLEDDEANHSPEYLRDLKWAAASMYGGGADTTVSIEYAFFLAMILFPEVQKKAQAEIDAVVGNDRLPTFADMPHLPYVNAVTTELLRWNSVAPLGVPHAAVEDSDGHINGYFIPKGAVIVTNLWNMLHDPESYPDPFKFDPERHLGPNPQRDVRKICFGFGRRICPGMHLADASVYSCIAMSLAVFNIEKALDSHGVPITPVHENTNSLISFPKPFECTIKPRSEKAYSLITEL